MKIGIMGAGYVGITTGVSLAAKKHQITIFDIDTKKINDIQNKKMPFFEKGLQELLETVVSDNYLTATVELDYLVQNTDGCFICVGTPTKNNAIDVSYICNALESLSSSIKNNNKENYVIVIRSTVVPTTTQKILFPIIKTKLNNQKIHLCVVPEFLREGNALDDFMNPDKIVIGSIDQYGSKFVEELFIHFKDKCKFIHTNLETAELIKYTNNSFFSMLISFSNEIANIAEKIPNVDPFQVLKALISDKRITSTINNEKIIPSLDSYLIPGCGFGGSCFPKDVKAIMNFAHSQNIDTPLLSAILQINDERPNKMVKLCESILGTLQNKKITILGLTFKPDTDDIRSSPSITAIKLFLEKGATISTYDPLIINIKNNGLLPKECESCTSIEESLQDSDAAIVFTKWTEFMSLNSEFLNKFMKKPLIIDGRGFLEKEKFEDGIYHKIGFLEK
jgi:UDPglucose 6-dehydrogenase/GDP-mannose 6-dehydrogenase